MKGLESPVCFIMRFIEGAFPAADQNPDEHEHIQCRY